MSQCTIQKDCTSCTSESLNNNEKCQWNGALQKCSSFGGAGYSSTCTAAQTSCAALTDCSSCTNGDCFWNSSYKVCGDVQTTGYVSTCSFGNQACAKYKNSRDCSNNDCSWNSTYCGPPLCGNYTDLSGCVNNNQCAWNPNTFTCALAAECGDYQDSTSCVDNACVWNPNSGTCGTEKCAIYANASTCNANSCYWSTQSMTCTSDPTTPEDDQCAANTDCSSCTTNFCFWNDRNQMCGADPKDGSANCYDAKCSPHTDCSSCTTDSCYWNVMEKSCGANPAIGISSCSDSIDDYLAMLAQLQNLEESLYNVLKENADNVLSGQNTVLTEDEIANIVDQINRLSEYRMTTYNTIAENYVSKLGQQSSLNASNAEQLASLKLLEAGMNESKAKLQASKTLKLNNMKMIEINTYQGKEYEAHAILMRDVFFLVLLLVVAAVIGRFVPALGNVLFSVLKWGGGIYIAYRFIDIIMRRNDNYDEYAFPAAPTSDAQMLAADSSNGSVIQVTGVDVPDFCAGAYCCGPGTQWSDSQGCVVTGT
jgi:hypothetical protein